MCVFYLRKTKSRTNPEISNLSCWSNSNKFGKLSLDPSHIYTLTRKYCLLMYQTSHVCTYVDHTLYSYINITLWKVNVNAWWVGGRLVGIYFCPSELPRFPSLASCTDQFAYNTLDKTWPAWQSKMVCIAHSVIVILSAYCNLLCKVIILAKYFRCWKLRLCVLPAGHFGRVDRPTNQASRQLATYQPRPDC